MIIASSLGFLAPSPSSTPRRKRNPCRSRCAPSRCLRPSMADPASPNTLLGPLQSFADSPYMSRRSFAEKEENLEEGYKQYMTTSRMWRVYKSSGAVTDMWIKAKELGANTEYLLELLAKGIGKPKEEIKKGMELPRYYDAQDANAYRIADKIIKPEDDAFEKNYDEQFARPKAMRKAAGAGPQATQSGFGLNR